MPTRDLLTEVSLDQLIASSNKKCRRHLEAQRPATEILAFARIKHATATKTDRLIVLLSGFNAYKLYCATPFERRNAFAPHDRIITHLLN